MLEVIYILATKLSRMHFIERVVSFTRITKMKLKTIARQSESAFHGIKLCFYLTNSSELETENERSVCKNLLNAKHGIGGGLLFSMGSYNFDCYTFQVFGTEWR